MKVVCPVDGTIHHAEGSFSGRFLRCAKCGRAVLIGPGDSKATVAVNPRVSGVKGNALWPIRREAVHPGKRREHALFVGGLLLASTVLGAVVWLYQRRPEPVTHLPVVATSAAPQENTPDDPFAQIAKANPVGEAVQAPVEREGRGDQETGGSGMNRSFFALAAPANTCRPKTDPGGLKHSLPTGTRVMEDSGTGGRGILFIDNVSGIDAVVEVVSASDETVRDVYVRGGTSLSVPRLEAGEYKIIFATGEGWDSDAVEFTCAQDFFELGHVVAFRETQDGQVIRYGQHDITLYTRPDGNITRERIDKETFKKHQIRKQAL